MLEVLRIRNLAVIAELTWELHEGFNILTGETGAGKSILIDAFSLLLGDKADRGLLRDGTDHCTIEAGLSECGAYGDFLESNGIDAGEDGQIILKRVISRKGGNKQFINGSPTTLQILRELGEKLVDIHGPHDHQSLLLGEEQRRALDAFCQIEDGVKAYGEGFREWRKLVKELEELSMADDTGWRQQMEFLTYQIEEIQAAELKEEDEEELERAYRVAQNQQQILEVGGGIDRVLEGDGEDVFSMLGGVQRLLQEWERLDESVKDLVELNEGVVAQVQELQNEVQHRMAQVEMDGEATMRLEQRMDLIQSLKKKYGGTVEAILKRMEEMEIQRDGLANREGRIQELEVQVASMEKKLWEAGEKLSKARVKGMKKLGVAITGELQHLGFKKASFSGGVRRGEQLKDHGCDEVEFLFEPNPGQKARPLKMIASSGEMARVMLAVKTVLAKQDEVPILIFDEVDANVGGETAVAVASKLRGLADSHQVLCITHLPQVAAAGHAHVRVEKRVKGGETITDLSCLDKKGRVEELARMLGGKNEAAISLAEEMLGGAEK